MPRRTVIIVSCTLAALAVAGFAGSRAAEPMARPALGFVAKTICSNVFVGGATADQALADLPDEPIARLVRTRVDHAAGRVITSVPLIARREAVYRPDDGCTLVPADDTAPDNVAASLRDTAVRHRGAAWAITDTLDILQADTAGHSAAHARDAVTAIDRTRLNAVVEEAFTEPDPALPRRTRAVIVVHRGRIVAERYAAGYGPASRFTGWSMTKSVTAALVGIMTTREGLDIREAGLRPEWRSGDDPRSAITLHDLLTMTSGLGFDESYAPTGGATRMLFDARDAAAIAATSPLVHEPGSMWAYSSATTNIISSVIRDRFDTDAEYIAFPREALFERIGMSSAILEADPSGTLVGSSFMYATARDWARFGLLFLRDGRWNGERILPEGWVEYSTTPAPSAPLGQYGAHWWLNAGEATEPSRRMWPDLPANIFWASGFQGQYIAVVPSHDLVVVRLGVTADERAFSLGTFLRDVMATMDVSAAAPS